MEFFLSWLCSRGARTRYNADRVLGADLSSVIRIVQENLSDCLKEVTSPIRGRFSIDSNAI